MCILHVYMYCTCICCLHGVIEDDHHAPFFLWPWLFFVSHFSLVQLNPHDVLHKLCSSIIIIIYRGVYHVKENLYMYSTCTFTCKFIETAAYKVQCTRTMYCIHVTIDCMFSLTTSYLLALINGTCTCTMYWQEPIKQYMSSWCWWLKKHAMIKHVLQYLYLFQHYHLVIKVH